MKTDDFAQNAQELQEDGNETISNLRDKAQQWQENAITGARDAAQAVDRCVRQKPLGSRRLRCSTRRDFRNYPRKVSRLILARPAAITNTFGVAARATTHPPSDTDGRANAPQRTLAS